MSQDPPPPDTDPDDSADPADLAHFLDDRGTLKLDVPCIRCGYNLRGLPTDQKCPECGATVRRTLAYASRQALCPTCMAPNHATQAVCVRCGGAMNAAASTADYFRAAPLPMSEKTKALLDQGPPPPPVLPMALTWLICGPTAWFFFSRAWDIWDLRRDTPVALALSGAAVIFLVLGLLPTRTFFRRLREYRAHEERVQAQRDKENEDDDPA